MDINLIEFELSLDSKALIRLTERTIRSADFITSKVHDHQEITRDIALRLEFENSSVNLRTSASSLDSNENMEDAEQMPDEIDSIINLLEFAVSSAKRQLAYLDGKVKISNEIGAVVEFSYINLFVLSFSEEYKVEKVNIDDTKNTCINIVMREKAR